MQRDDFFFPILSFKADYNGTFVIKPTFYYCVYQGLLEIDMAISYNMKLLYVYLINTERLFLSYNYRPIPNHV